MACSTAVQKKSGTGTLVRLRHQGFAGAPKSAVDHSQGWTRVLTWMQGFVEAGATADSRG